MSTTLLEITNQVMVAMREPLVLSTADPYAALVASLVNDALYQVEAAHDWSALYTEFVQSILSDESPAILGSGNMFKIQYIISNTSNQILIERARRWITSEFIKNGALYGTPASWCNKGVSAAGDATIQLDRVPSSEAENITIVGFQRTPRLVLDTDTIIVPITPVRDLAIAMAVRERGDIGGQASAEYFEIAKRTLSDAIAYDSARNDDEDVWYVR
jgi:hypothetical protein